jgi:hypothetical protein
MIVQTEIWFVQPLFFKKIFAQMTFGPMTFQSKSEMTLSLMIFGGITHGLNQKRIKLESKGIFGNFCHLPNFLVLI